MGQSGLFGGSGQDREILRLNEGRPWPDFERLSLEASAIGFHMSAHPLDAYRTVLRRLGVTPSNALENAAKTGTMRVKIAGCVVDKKERPTRTGKKMAWVNLSDSGGGCEVTLFAETLISCRDLLVAGQAILVTAELKLDGDALRITAQSVMDLETAAAAERSEMRVWLKQMDALPTLSEMLAEMRGGHGKVVFLPSLEETRDVEIALPGTYRVTPRLAERLRTVRGVEKAEQR